MTGCRLLTNPNLKSALAAKEAELARKHDLSRERVLMDLIAGIELAEKMGNPAAMIEGAAQIAKMLGYNAPTQVKHKVSVGRNEYQKKLGRMSDAELTKLLAEEAE